MKVFLKSSHLLPRLSNREYRTLAFPIPLTITGLLFLFWIRESLTLGDITSRTRTLAAGVVGLIFCIIVLGFILPRLQQWRWMSWMINLFSGSILAMLVWLSPEISFILHYSIYLAILVALASLTGRALAYAYGLTFLITSFILQLQTFTITLDYVTLAASLVFTSFIIVESILRLENIIVAKVKRLEAINQIAKIISSTIDLDQVIGLLNIALHETIEADTHFLGLLEGDKLRLEWFFDDGEYFPPTQVSLKGCLSRWVIEQGESLLLNNVPREGLRFGMDGNTIGKNKVSLSWAGTPLRASGKIIGILALASYRLNAFHPEDLELLENVAQQAALIIENAQDHAKVVEQSRRDSLTQVYNHGYFLKFMQEFIHEPSCHPMSLIMLDVDYFKPFNDTHGHQTGDRALVKVVECVRGQIRSTDIIGRWGGEEFGILLPNANKSHARQVAERIRDSLNSTTIANRNGQDLPVPTASMGIAVLPDETSDPETFIHLADQRLYLAKSRGRNQIEDDQSVWSLLDANIP